MPPALLPPVQVDSRTPQPPLSHPAAAPPSADSLSAAKRAPRAAAVWRCGARGAYSTASAAVTWRRRVEVAACCVFRCAAAILCALLRVPGLVQPLPLRSLVRVAKGFRSFDRLVEVQHLFKVTFQRHRAPVVIDQGSVLLSTNVTFQALFANSIFKFAIANHAAYVIFAQDKASNLVGWHWSEARRRRGHVWRSPPRTRRMKQAWAFTVRLQARLRRCGRMPQTIRRPAAGRRGEHRTMKRLGGTGGKMPMEQMRERLVPVFHVANLGAVFRIGCCGAI